MRGESEALAGSVDRLASSIESSVRHGPGAERARIATRSGVLGAVLGSVAGALATALLSLIQSILRGA